MHNATLINLSLLVAFLILSHTLGDVSVDTADAADVLSRMDYIIASLEKAGIPLAELMHFKELVERTRSPEYGAGAADVVDDASSAAIAEGALEKLQQGVHRFAPVWKTQWVRLLPGEMQVFESSNRPEPGTPLLFSLPLSVQQTRIESGWTLKWVNAELQLLTISLFPRPDVHTPSATV